MPQKRLYTFSQALAYAREYCAKGEHCQSEVKEKLRSYYVQEDEIDACLAELIIDGFINEQRYADLFAVSKFHQNKWGRIKIRMHLKAKEISEICIKKALKSIDEDEYMQTLDSLCKKKIEQTQEANPLKKKAKVVSFLASRGFEFERIQMSLENNLL